MRDPDLMQRADRAAIALEQAWERWRAMHGLGAEPLPPVSSYVGYSHEEPWGQPRVVFGLRADEAELLTSLLEGHDCAGSVYSELSARSDWRLPVSGPVSMPGRGYAGPLTVPQQAPPPGTDPLSSSAADGFASSRLDDGDMMPVAEPSDERGRSRTGRGAAGTGSARGRTGRTARSDRAARRTAEAVAEEAEANTEGEEPDWVVSGGEPSQEGLDADADAEAMDMSQSPPLAPLPDMPGLRQRSDEDEPGEPEQPGAAPRATGNATAKTPGPGYRGPRYQGFPPRYDAGPSSGTAAARPAVPMDEDDDPDVEIEPTATRKTHVAKLSRSARRRTQGS
jgi:hypothetical protein